MNVLDKSNSPQFRRVASSLPAYALAHRLQALLAKTLLVFSLSWTPLNCFALSEITEDELSEVTGEGVGILPLDFRVLFDENTYIRAIPRGAPDNGSGVAGGTGRPTDLYWYGLSLGEATGNLNNRNGAVMTRWGSASNPWVLLATSPSYLWYKGNGEVNTTAAYPVFRYAAPAFTAASDFSSASVANLHYGFFGDLVVCNAGTPNYGSTSVCGARGFTNAGSGVLRSISVWDGFSVHGSQYNIFQSTVDYGKYMGDAASEFKSVNTGNGSTLDDSGTFGVVWLNRLNSAPTGVLRFGVGDLTGSSLTVPETGTRVFSLREGLYLADLDINMPIGHLHYQPLIFDSQGNGNMVIELVRIPNNATIYNYAYRTYSDTTAPSLAKMCNNDTVDCSDATHGQLRVGELYYKDDANVKIQGTRSADTTLAASVAVDGIFLQHLKIRTLGL